MLIRVVVGLALAGVLMGLTLLWLRQFQLHNREVMACRTTGGVMELQKVGEKYQKVCAWRPAPDRVLR